MISCPACLSPPLTPSGRRGWRCRCGSLRGRNVDRGHWFWRLGGPSSGTASVSGAGAVLYGPGGTDRSGLSEAVLLSHAEEVRLARLAEEVLSS